ncbi:MAG: formyltransferase family protein [Nitrospiraceae bacterium]
MTQPDRPRGAEQDVVDSPSSRSVSEAHPFLNTTKMKDPAFLEALRAWQPDIITVTAFGRILPPAVLNLPPNGCGERSWIVAPEIPGAGPVQWASFAASRKPGSQPCLWTKAWIPVPMLLQEAIPIEPDDTAGTLAPGLAKIGGRLLVETLRQLEASTLIPRQQDHTQASRNGADLEKEDGAVINWSAVDIGNRI